MLSHKHQRKRVDSVREFLRRYEKERKNFSTQLLLEAVIFSRPFKKHLRWMHITSDEKVTATVNKFLRETVEEWYDGGGDKEACSTPPKMHRMK